MCRETLGELNQYVSVGMAEVGGLTEEHTKEILGTIDGAVVVVVTVPPLQKLLFAIDDKYPSVGAGFILAMINGVFSRVFCDFGAEFLVSDTDGEQPAQGQIENVLPSDPANVKVLEDHGRHGLETWDYVTFLRVKGPDVDRMTFRDATREFKVRSTGPYTFELVGVDLSMCDAPATQGYITQVKKPKTVGFKSIREAM